MLKRGVSFFLSWFILTGCQFFEKKKEEKILREYKNNPLVYIPPSVFPASGNPLALIKMDIFFDPWCGPCRNFDKTVVSKILLDPQYQNKIAIFYHLFPLEVLYDFDREASLLHLEMVKQNLYKEFRKQIESQNIKKFPDMLSLAEEISGEHFSMALLEERHSKTFLEEVTTAKNLGLTYTPNIFINHKQISIPSIENLKTLIDTIKND